MYIYFIYFKSVNLQRIIEGRNRTHPYHTFAGWRILGYWKTIFPATNPSQSTINVAHVDRAAHIQSMKALPFFLLKTAIPPDHLESSPQTYGVYIYIYMYILKVNHQFWRIPGSPKLAKSRPNCKELDKVEGRHHHGICHGSWLFLLVIGRRVVIIRHGPNHTGKPPVNSKKLRAMPPGRCIRQSPETVSRRCFVFCGTTKNSDYPLAVRNAASE